MKKNTPRKLIAAWLLIMSAMSIQAQNIVHNGEGADLTFYYESAENTWHTVFRDKGSTDATGLTNPFPPYTGIVGHNSGDHQFDTLTVNINTTTQLNVNGTNYWLTSATGSPFLADGSTPDFGIRTRLRENEVALGTGTNETANQFDSFNFTLNLGASTFNGSPLTQAGSPDFVLLNWDGANQPDPMIETAAGNQTAEFSNWGHVHRNFGFSEFGQYNLVFDIDGVGGEYGPSSGGQVGVGFNVIPEPSTLMLFGLGMGLMARVLRRKRRA